MINDFFNKLRGVKQTSSAKEAKNRLQILIASSRDSTKFDFMPELEKEIINLVRKYIKIEEEDLKICIDTDEETGLNVLEMNINLPEDEEEDKK